MIATDSCSKLIGYLDCLYIFLQPLVFDHVQVSVAADDEAGGVKRIEVVAIDAILESVFLQLVHALMDNVVLPLITEAMFKAEVENNSSEEKAASPSPVELCKILGDDPIKSPALEYFQEVLSSRSHVFGTVDGMSPIHIPHTTTKVRPNSASSSRQASPSPRNNPSSSDEDQQQPINNGDTERDYLFQEVKDSLSVHSSCLLGALFKYGISYLSEHFPIFLYLDCVRKVLLEEKFFTLLIALIQEGRKDLMEQSIVSYSMCSKQGMYCLSEMIV